MAETAKRFKRIGVFLARCFPSRDMAKPKAKSAKSTNPKAPVRPTLTNSSGMGGLIGADGYDFQARYIVCRAPSLIGHAGFISLMNEGAGDLDIRYSNGLEHVQLKDHTITGAEFRDIVEIFRGWELTKAGVYIRYIIAAPSVNAQVSPILNNLQRIRDAGALYVGQPHALINERAELNARLSEIGLPDALEFALQKLYFQETPQLSSPDVATSLFIANLMKLSAYQAFHRAALEPCYAELLKHVGERRGKILDSVDLASVIQSSVLKASGQSFALLDVHGWSFEKLIPPADYVIDWTPHFDRDTRKVPSPDTCASVLLPQLKQLEKGIKASTDCRVLELRGKMSLTSALAIGACFPETAGWKVRFRQPQMQVPWASDAPRGRSYDLRVINETGDPKSAVLAAIVNITSIITNEVKDYLADTGISYRSLLIVEPQANAGSLSIADAHEASSLAIAVRDHLKRLRNQIGAKETHVFFCGPAGLGILIGQQLTSVGVVHLYEYQSPGYARTFTLMT